MRRRHPIRAILGVGIRPSKLYRHVVSVTSVTAVLLAIGIVALATAADSPNHDAASDPADQMVSIPPNPVEVAGPERPNTGTGRSRNLKPCPPEGSKAVNFSAYYVGNEFQGLSLKKRLRVCNEPYPDEPVRGNYIAYLYGDCDPSGMEGGCPYPLEVQTAPACEWNPAVFSAYLAREPRALRGVQAAYFAEQKRLQVYTGDATVDIYGHEKEQILAAAESLQSVPEDQRPEKQPAVSRAADLPAPAPGALQDELPC